MERVNFPVKSNDPQYLTLELSTSATPGGPLQEYET